ncbi:MAG: ABC transporter permease [bacterium]|nr:ABC transporter permease [bacterium]
MLLGAIVLALLAGTIAFCTIKEMDASGTSISVPVAIVVEDQSDLFNLLLSFLADMQSTEQHFVFRVMSETNAYHALDDGSVAAVMLVPKDVIDGILDGTNIHVQVLLSETNALAAILLQELSAAGAKTLSAAQAGTYAMTTLYRMAGRADALSDAYTALDLRNLSYALARGDLFHTVRANATGEESVLVYYLASGILLFLLLFGICYLSFYGKSNTACQEKERACGIGYPTVLLSRLGGILLYQLFLFLLLAVLTPFLARAYLLSAPNCLHMLGLAAMILFSVSSFFFFLYELIPAPGYAMLLLFLLSILMMLVSGCLIPNAFLPAWCRRIAAFLPVRPWMQILFSILGYPAHSAHSAAAVNQSLLTLAADTVFFFAGGCLAHVFYAKRRG